MSTTEKQTSSTTENLEPEYSDRGWEFGMLTRAGKETRRIADDYSELYIQETPDYRDTEADYTVQYREGRLGPSTVLEHGEFDDLAEAHEYCRLILEGHVEVEELI
ncbi:hypothetical protein [Candidatus Nanohalovita haloferacivicina]|uniref:hypothetical protein n=1 Tax=Candidatus Nanohalovita haloferacivicina TaxID=2978046 RepID=UPI00325FCB28|nr:hypothetical protein HBNXNv_0936 [Candidatus Nanohalobia archaeon BNXNv]